MPKLDIKTKMQTWSELVEYLLCMQLSENISRGSIATEVDTMLSSGGRIDRVPGSLLALHNVVFSRNIFRNSFFHFKPTQLMNYGAKIQIHLEFKIYCKQFKRESSNLFKVILKLRTFNSNFYIWSLITDGLHKARKF